eukprot:CAMPEP_0203667292 /NCGR_PEP_ID=MMETSP0090-20130426/4157_1 /ASSEMBLY_ACC=CAM_ASM_001088 /TAXON_ID=426623 /ORGANISM="Chaetoceros affinis, Strain CCMP159" /LENGTH=677 /DNA_ID=CAMNT_0050531411 /DNA_START=32 /DNA_END=2065 /DNA_ORIENTATION=+
MAEEEEDLSLGICSEDSGTYGFISADRQKFGEIAPRITGSLSVVSSALIIVLVLRSSTRLSSTYHRIMVGLSTTDIICSTAMALTHLPFPRPGLSPCVDQYSYQGLRLGNTQTCTAQGFFLVFGQLSTYAYNAALSIYFACAIYFKLKKKTIQNRVEPVLHLVAVVVPFSLALTPLADENYNPTAEHCAIDTLPATCIGDGTNCERGNPDALASLTVITLLLVSVMLILVWIALALVCWTAFSDSRTIRRYREQRDEEQHEQSMDADSDDVETSDSAKHISSNMFILQQALSYIGALIITLIFPILTITSDRYAYGDQYLALKEVIRRLQLVFQPSQGIFNFLIFLSSKIYQQRVADKSISRFDALKKIFGKNHDDPIIISRLSMVQNYTNANAFDLKFEDYDDEDEEEEEKGANHDNDDDMDGISYSLPPRNEKTQGVNDDEMEGVSYPSRSGISSRRENQSHRFETWSAFSWFSRKTDSMAGRDNGGSAVSSTGLQSVGHLSSAVSSIGVQSPNHFSKPLPSAKVLAQSQSPRQNILRRMTEEGEEEEYNFDDDSYNPPDPIKRYSKSLFVDNAAMTATGAEVNDGYKGGNATNNTNTVQSSSFKLPFRRQSTLEGGYHGNNIVQTQSTSIRSTFKRQSVLKEDDDEGNGNVKTAQNVPIASSFRRRSVLEEEDF